MQRWLICYAWQRRNMPNYKFENEIIDTHPADWLRDYWDKYPDQETKIVMAIPYEGNLGSDLRPEEEKG